MADSATVVWESRHKERGDEGAPWSSSLERATFTICGANDAQTERAIERFIDGHGFATVLVSRLDGCADLTIVRLPRWAAAGRQSVTVTFSSGQSGRIRVVILSENGLTRVDLVEGG